ncbi:MAG: hypothetical protein AAAB17_26410, partial [Pseudomonas sp.]
NQRPVVMNRYTQIPVGAAAGCDLLIRRPGQRIACQKNQKIAAYGSFLQGCGPMEGKCRSGSVGKAILFNSKDLITSRMP